MNWEPYIIWFWALVVFPGSLIAWTWFWTGPADRWVKRNFPVEGSAAKPRSRTKTRHAVPSYKFVSAVDPKAMAARSKRRKRRARDMARKVEREG